MDANFSLIHHRHRWHYSGGSHARASLENQVENHEQKPSESAASTKKTIVQPTVDEMLESWKTKKKLKGEVK